MTFSPVLPLNSTYCVILCDNVYYKAVLSGWLRAMQYSSIIMGYASLLVLLHQAKSDL